jgi:hypothetical protein
LAFFVVGITLLVYTASGYRLLLLPECCLPVALADLYLDRYRSGMAAILCLASGLIVVGADIAESSFQMGAWLDRAPVLAWVRMLGALSWIIAIESTRRSRQLDDLHARLTGACAAAERLRQQVTESVIGNCHGSSLPFAVSIGVVEVLLDEDVVSVFGRAEATVNLASQPGGNDIYVHDGQKCERAAVLSCG